MRTRVRFAVALVVSLGIHEVALACSCEAVCVKSADVAVVGPTYPATVNYQIQFSCKESGACGGIYTLSDSLLPADYFSSQLPFAFWVGGKETISYSIEFGSYDQCKALSSSPPAWDGSVTVTNIVNASGASVDGSPPFTCQRDIICRPPPTGTGCTLTPGYWKTHSEYGPAANPDATWDLVLPNGADSPFFLSGQSWFEVLWSDSTLKYYILARAYVATKLNVLAGASTTSEVDGAIAFAETFFGSYLPSDELDKSTRTQVTGAAGILDNYNNGITGPGHCSE